uniref:Uncharacterized protein n=1 Tax=Globodera rostochiensis TaxID=31243 RepID=A0A914GUN0_GLORO
MLFLDVLFLLSFLNPSIYCARIGKKLPSTSPSKKLDLPKRPLNAYIVENGKHAMVQNKSIQIWGGNDPKNSSITVKYHILRPPFAIKQRGGVILLDNGTSWLDWHRGRPSIIQMVAASGHAAVAPELEWETDVGGRAILKIIEWEKLHRLVFLGTGPRGVELINEWNGMVTADQLDAFVLLNGSGESLPRLRTFREDMGNGERPPVVVVGTTVVDGWTGAKTVEMDWDPKSLENGQRVAQLLVNLLDWVHPR